MLQYVLLWLFHLVLALKRFVSTLLPRRLPRPLQTRRRKIPEHLAVTLRSEGAPGNAVVDLAGALESVTRLVGWCRIAGIQTLSVFDEAGTLLESWEQIYIALESAGYVTDVNISKHTEPHRNIRSKKSAFSTALRLPPTPPLSKTASASSILSSSPELHGYSGLPVGEHDSARPKLVKFEVFNLNTEPDSRKQEPLAPQGTSSTTKPLTLYILSKDMGKSQLAGVAREMANSVLFERKNSTKGPSDKAAVTVSSLTSRLEDKSRADGWPCPDLLLIYTPTTSRQAQLSPLEFDGFPPWQIHLTEITYAPPILPQTEFLRSFWSIPKQFPTSITERAFRTALDEYDGAEMRFGK